MEPIDFAAEQLRVITADIQAYRGTVVTEQDTRLKIINRVLTEVLRWSHADIATEEQAGDGYLDYKLMVDGLARLIVEAKRDARSLGLSTQTPGRAYKLNGPVFRTESVREGIAQAIRYCGQKNAELACVTNGHEWVVFRGSRLGDGHDTMEGRAFVFPSLDAVQAHFALFYSLLSSAAVRAFQYRAHFQEVEGRLIRTHEFRRALRPADSRRLVGHGPLAGDLERVMLSFFRRISGEDDPDLLAQCFVVTTESQRADETLARISEDLIRRIRTLETGNAEELTRLIERVKQTQRNEFVLLVGTKGAGKSTFIDRFFRYVLPRQLLDDCLVVKINLADSEGDDAGVPTWLNHHLLHALEQAIFGEDAPTYEELQGMFYDEYTRWRKGTLRPLYEQNKAQFQIEFGHHIERRREERPHEYIERLLAHVVSLRRKLPCIIFDNADHFTIEFQERVFQYARSLYEKQICLVIMPITDRTSWHLSREGALRSFESESLFLPTPSPRKILEKRIRFLEMRLAEEKGEPGRGYFVGRGIHLSLEDLTAFTAALQSVFLRTGTVARWIGNLANQDVRRCLEIAKNTVTSPHLEVEELLKAYIAGSSIWIPEHKIERAIIKERYDIYPSQDHRFVQNIYWLDDELETSPLLGLRLLLLLRDAQKADARNHFLTVEQTVDYLRAMVVEPRAVLRGLEKMLETGLCLSYDPTVTSINQVRQVELSPAGWQHLYWGMRDPNYIQAMIEVTPLVDPEVYEKLTTLRGQPRSVAWRLELECFCDYLIAEDRKFCQVPQHPAYESQERLCRDLKKSLNRARKATSLALVEEC